MLRKLLAFLWIAHLLTAQPTGRYPSVLIEDSVNVITGQCSIFTQDIEVRGAEPISLNRVFVNGTQKKKYAGWKFIPHLRLYRVVNDLAPNHIYFNEPDGTTVYFDLPYHIKDKIIDLDPSLDKTFQARTYSQQYTISGKNNIKNIKAQITKDKKDVYITSANGCQRYYKEKKRLETDKTRKYLLQWEDLPNGNRLVYKYDDDCMLERITTCNPDVKDRVFAEWWIKKHSEARGAPNFTALTSDGQETVYLYEHYKDEKKNYKNALELIIHREKPKERYTYTTPDKKSGRLIETREFADKQTLRFSYYKQGKNKTDQGEFYCKHKDEYQIDRVKEILADNKVIYTFDYGRMKNGIGYTRVWDAGGNLTVYQYNDLHQIIKIRRHHRLGHLLNEELYIYGKDGNKNNLLGIIIHDKDEHPIAATTYRYDDWGNIIEETNWGEITGRSTSKLQLDGNSLPIDNGIDVSTKTFHYTQDGRNLLVYEKTQNGLETIYQYPHKSCKHSGLLSAKFLKFDNKICRRTFYEYDSDHFLVKETKDDGSSEDPGSDASVTERHIFKTHRFNDGPFIGMPKCIEEYYIDLNTHREILVIKTQFLYHPNRKVHEKKVYDNQNKLTYTQTYEYDEHSNLISETDPIGRQATGTYNDFMKKETFIDFDGLVKHTFEYDSLGRLKKTTHTDQDGSCKVEQCTYNDLGQCDSKTDWYGNTTRFTYNPLGNLTETKLPDGTILRTHYNALSYPIAHIDGEGHTTTIRPNIYNKPLEIHHPDNTIETYRYNLTGNLEEVIQPHGTVTRYEYDHFDRLTSTTIYNRNKILTKETSTYSTLHLREKKDPLGQIITYDYDGAGRKIREADGTFITHFGYDNLGRLSTVKTGTCTQTTHYDFVDRPRQETIHDGKNNLVSDITYTYDTFNNKTGTLTYVDGHASTEKIDYDHFSRPFRFTDPMGNITTISYNDRHINSKGQLVLCKTETSPTGTKTITLYDILGRVESCEILSPFGTLLSRCTYQYDHNNNCIEQVDTVTEDSRTWHITTQRKYTPTNKIKTLIEAQGTKEQKTTLYQYDHSGRLDLLTDPNGTVIEYTYNPLSQIETLTTTNVAYRYHYDLLGRIIKVEDLINHTSTLRAYDTQGNLEEETLGNGLTLQSKYDTEGRRYLLTLPDNTTIRYTYDDYYLRAITRTNHHTTYTHQLLEYDLSSNLLAETNTTHHYNLDGAPQEIHSPTLSQIVTERDLLGNILTQITNNNTETFTYSPLSQLTSEPNHEYTYDTIHNRTSKDTQPYTYNNANQLRTTATEKFDYDTAGYPRCKITSTETTHYTYDGLGRLIEAQTPYWRLTFTYDSFHRCLSRTLYTKNITKHQNFLYDETCEIGSTDENHNILELRILKDSTQAEIGSAIALELNGITYTPIHDLRGNICGLLQNDTLIETIHYTAYGEASQHSTLNPWTFRSKRYDPQLQLINFGRRYYDPTTGRFFTPDPKGFVDGLNLYAYCHNNPLNRIDLYGLHINVQFSVNLSTVSNTLGTIIYQTFNHFVPIPVVREVGMATGNLLSGNWTRPVRSESSIGQVQNRAKNGCRFLAVNGVLNNKSGIEETSNFISSCLNGLKVDFYHSTTRGLLSDILAAAWGSLGFQTADSIGIAATMRRQILFMKEYESNDPKLFVFAHSRGGIYLCNALKLMTPEERKAIHVSTYGSASLFGNRGLADLHHYVASGDPIPMCDPLNYLKGRLLHTPHVHFLPGQGNFFTRHLVLEDSYSDAINFEAQRILKMIGE